MRTMLSQKVAIASKAVRRDSAYVLGIVGIASMASFAAGPSISGSVEAGYNYNFSTLDSVPANRLHSYDAMANTFTLNNANVVFAGSDSTSGIGYDVKTVFGSDAKANRALDASSGGADIIDLQEAFLTYAFGKGRSFGLKAGKYVTYEGIEVVEGGSNPTVTRGLLFGLLEPVSHTGLEISNTMGPLDIHVGVINGWDNLMDNNDMPSFLAKVGYSGGDPISLTISTIIGPEKTKNTDDMRMSFDVTGVTKIVPKLDLWFQGNYGMEAKASLVKPGDDASWLGLGLQPLYHFNDRFAMGLRYEFMNDVGASRTVGAADVSVQNISIAPSYYLSKTAMVRAEFRADFASKDIFVDKKGKAAGNQMELAADFVTSF